MGAGAKELTAVGFFPQTGFQCGPAALATLLTHRGVEVNPDQLSDQVYLPKGYGSLQIELLAASRRYQTIPYLVDGFDDLKIQVSNGNPVLVLQRVRNWWVPAWHYAVVVGFDDVQRQVILRSGTEKRRIVSYRHFSNTWQKGNQWGFVALTPGALPATPDAGRYLDAVINAESHLTTDQSIAAYRAAVARWPENTAALFGLGNMQYRDGQQGAAELSWQKVLQRQSNHAGAANNLAELLAEKGEVEQAIALLETTLAGSLAPESLRPVLLETRQKLKQQLPPI
jgi:tetratricopeptide (TPR) repeat protein